MGDLSDVIRILPPMKSGNELLSALEVLPECELMLLFVSWHSLTSTGCMFLIKCL